MTDKDVFQFGQYVIPSEYIAEDGYECTPNQRQDIDPFTDQYGVTHRNTVPHTKTDVTITFRDLKWAEYQNLIHNLTANYAIISERDATCVYLDTETMTFKTGHLYLDPSFKVKVKRLNDKISSFSLRFTEY